MISVYIYIFSPLYIDESSIFICIIISYILTFRKVSRKLTKFREYTCTIFFLSSIYIYNLFVLFIYIYILFVSLFFKRKENDFIQVFFNALCAELKNFTH